MNRRALFLLAIVLVSIVFLSLVAQFYAPALATRIFLLF